MPGEPRISTAFQSFFSEADPDEKREAIVIYRAPTSNPRVRGRLRQLKSRLDMIKASAAAQRPIQKDLFDGYQKAVGKPKSGAQELSTSPISVRTPFPCRRSK